MVFAFLTNIQLKVWEYLQRHVNFQWPLTGLH